MKEYELVGGPEAGRRLMVQPGVHEIVVPIKHPVEVFTGWHEGPQPTFDEVRYYRAGNVYRWEGLIEDAWSDMAVTEQAMVQSGPPIRRVIREQMRRALQDLAPEKELDRIIWRVEPESYVGRYKVSAIVGPRRVERGLEARESRRSAVRSANGMTQEASKS